MSIPNFLTEEFIGVLFPALNDQIAVLADNAARLANGRASNKQIRVADDDKRTRGQVNSHGSELANAMPNFLLESWDELRDGALYDYLTHVADWSNQMNGRGIGFVAQLQVLDTYRRAGNSAIVEKFEPGHQSQLVLNAVDLLDTATRTILALTCIDWVQEKPRQGSQSRTFHRLMAGMTHSFNNSLATIIGRAQLLEENERRESTRAELRAIAAAAQTMADDLRNIQDYTAHPVTDLYSVDVNSVASQAIQLTRFRWQDDAEAAGILIEVVCDFETVPAAWASPGLLRDALVELIMNAVDAMLQGGEIAVLTKSLGNRVIISVHDSGTGMDAAILERALDPFFSTRGVTHAGLGLTRAQDAVHRQGGKLTLESGVGRGTTAIIELSLTSNPRSISQPAQSVESSIAGVLVVDDDSGVRSIARRASILRGYRVVEAESGFEAIRLFREQGPFEVVLCDFGMPNLNGFEVARALKALDPKCVFILITGWASKLDPQKMSEIGIDRALTKPFTIEHVAQLISEALTLRENL